VLAYLAAARVDTQLAAHGAEASREAC
jgi:hypothetical protein